MPILLPNPPATYTQVTVYCPASDLAQQSSRIHCTDKPYRRGRSCLRLLQVFMAFLALAVTTPAIAQSEVKEAEPGKPKRETGIFPGGEPHRPVDPQTINKIKEGFSYSVLHIQKGWLSTKISLTQSGRTELWEVRDSDPQALGNLRK